jgi:hypothetical protein
MTRLGFDLLMALAPMTGAAAIGRGHLETRRSAAAIPRKPP